MPVDTRGIVISDFKVHERGIVIKYFDIDIHTHRKTYSLIGESRRHTDEYQFEKETKEV